MRRSYIVSDWFYRVSHVIKRNRAAVVLYALCVLLFLILGIAIGVNVGDKTAYILRNKAPIFVYLRGDIGAVAFFFTDFLMTLVYAVFALSMFFHRVAAFLSLAPCMYKAYSLGMQATVIVTVYSASSMPMLFVFFVPVCIIEIAVICMLSFKCFAFASLNVRCSPSKADVKEHYVTAIPFVLALVFCALIKAVTAVLFGSALIGVL